MGQEPARFIVATTSAGYGPIEWTLGAGAHMTQVVQNLRIRILPFRIQFH